MLFFFYLVGFGAVASSPGSATKLAKGTAITGAKGVGTTLTPPTCGTINVPGDYATIQAAVNAACSGAVILIAPGTYNEQVVVSKPLTLTGVSQTGTIIDGTGLGAGNGITLQDNIAGITIGNLTIQKQPGTGNNGVGNGIYGQTNNNLTITGVTSVSNATHGIILETSGTLTDVSVTSSTLSSNGAGNGGRGFIIFNNLKQNITQQ